MPSTLRVVRHPLVFAAVVLVLLATISLHQHQQGRAPWALAPFGSAHAAAASGRTAEQVAIDSLLNGVPDEQLKDDKENYKFVAEHKLRQLEACNERGNCHANANKIVILTALHCHLGIFNSYRGGEGVWCLGMIESLERQGYTVLTARSNWPYALELYQRFPDKVKAIIGDDLGDQGYAHEVYKTKDRPDGIPAWKHFLFYYFPNPWSTEVGEEWIITAEPPYEPWNPKNFTFLGYALQPPPDQLPFIPHAKRPNRAWILSKRLEYFYDSKWGTPTFTSDFYERATKDLRAEFPDFEFAGGFFDDRLPEEKEKDGLLPEPAGVRNVGLMDSVTFDNEVANSRILVGIGKPGTSPSPYRALSMGVPFLNPHLMFPESKQDDPRTWGFPQHDGLRTHVADKPYVYHVEAGDYDGFVDAIRQALRTGIERHPMPWLTQEALDERMRTWVEADWRAKAAVKLENRINGNETKPFENAPNSRGPQIFEL